MSCKNFALRCAAFSMLASAPLLAQGGVQLDNSETLFAVLTAINNCGYDAELTASDPVRMTVRRKLVAISKRLKRPSQLQIRFARSTTTISKARMLARSLLIYLWRFI